MVTLFLQMELVLTLEEWRCASMAAGGQSVMTPLEQMMQPWSVDS